MKQNDSYSSEIPSQAWVDERKHYIGGSDVAAILGESSYRTPLQVWLRKKGLIDPVGSTPIMEFGNVFEPVMADYFTHQTGLKVRRVNESYTHSSHPFLKANIDRQILNGDGVDGTGVLELKTTTSHRLKSLDGEYPIEWDYQVQHYLGLTGYNYAYLFIYERDTCKYCEPILIQRDEKRIAETQQKLIRWWQRHMVEGIRPDPINGEDALLLYPAASDGKVVEASADDRAYYDELLRVREKINDLQLEKDLLEAFLKSSIGQAERLVGGGRDLITWKNTETNRLDTKALKQRYPALCKKFTKKTKTRRFVVK